MIDWAEKDRLGNFYFMNRKLEIAKSLGYDYVSKAMYTEYQNARSLEEVGKMFYLTGPAIYAAFKRMGLPRRTVGGQYGNNLTDLTGIKIGLLTVLRRHKKDGRYYYPPHWVCRCECGNERVVPSRSIKLELVKSCGCMKRGRKRKNDRTSIRHRDNRKSFLQESNHGSETTENGSVGSNVV